MKQAIAFLLVMLLAMGADGIMEAFGPVKFLLIVSVVMAVAYILMRLGESNEARNLIDTLFIVAGIAAVAIAFWALMTAAR